MRVTQKKMTKDQIIKIFILSGLFIALRPGLPWLTGANQTEQSPSQFVIIMSAAFLLLSVGLVNFGFTKCVGIDLRRWWVFDRKRIAGDVIWGFPGFFLISFLSMRGKSYIPCQLTLVPPVQNQACRRRPGSRWWTACRGCSSALPSPASRKKRFSGAS